MITESENDYTLLKEDFSTKGWLHLLQLNSSNIFWIDKDSFMIPHKDISIIEKSDLQTFLLNDAHTSNELDEAVKKVLSEHNGTFEFKGDNEGLGFILNLREDNKVIQTHTFLRNDYIS